ncbi:hypothetical protein FRC01_010724 [Tulasnella sp. 417]|nr:hypothetical protein FRC01_010724 [Tulasnella sp. 417]
MTTETKEYKRALKHHLKTRQQSSQTDITPFRVEEKKYKSKFPPPDLSEVLDAWALDEDLRDKTLLGPTWNAGGNNPSVIARPIDLRTSNETVTRSGRGYCVDSHPGLVIIPSYLSPEEQRSLIRSSLENQARAPNETNLDTHYIIPEEGIWNLHVANMHIRDLDSCPKIIPRAQAQLGSGFRASTEFQPPEPPATSKRTLIENAPGEVALASPSSSPLPQPAASSSLSPVTPHQLLPKLRWANIGRSYHWGSKAYDLSKELAPFPEDVKDICTRVVKEVPWKDVWTSEGPEDIPQEEWGMEGPGWNSWPETYEPDAGIVNFYQSKDTLMGHVDRSEVSSTTPLVSISLGNAAIFLIGGTTRDTKPLAVILRSGDVVIMSGPRCRRAFHGVPRILEGTLPSHLSTTENGDDWEPFAEYMANTRVNINVRQVFPRGYDLSQLQSSSS